MIFHTFPAVRSAVLILAVPLLLAGCTPGMSAGVASLRYAIAVQRGPADTTKLDPNFAYLRVTRGRYATVVWRGVLERAAEGPVEVYYSGDGEVFRLREGRLVGVSGLPVEWRQVNDHAPGWNAVVQAREPITYTRVRDVMPGYRSGVRDELTLVRIEAPERSALRAVDPRGLTWFEERMHSRGSGSDVLPPARYALDLSGKEPLVLYSEQCVARDFCFAWQRWSYSMQQQAGARSR